MIHVSATSSFREWFVFAVLMGEAGLCAVALVVGLTTKHRTPS